jgi:hypothetical protein
MAMEPIEPLLGAEAYTMPLMFHATIVDSFNCLTLDLWEFRLVFQRVYSGDLCGSLNNLVRCDLRGFSTSFKQSVSHSEGKPQHLSRQIWLPWKLESHVTLVTSIHSRTGDDIKVTVASRRRTPGRHQQSKQQQQASQSSRVASPRAEAEAGLVSILIPVICEQHPDEQDWLGRNCCNQLFQ